jgi:two-component system nitrogen regulation sensor histidine kinase NtrY
VTKEVTKDVVTEAVKDTTPETKEPAAETKELAEKTNDSTKIEASTGI